MNARSRFIVFIVSAQAALPAAGAQDNARGAWRATSNDCFIQVFVLGDRGMASVRYSNGAGEQRARWMWGREGLNIVTDGRGVLLMDGHYEDTVLVAEVDYSTTDDVDFRRCSFERSGEGTRAFTPTDHGARKTHAGVHAGPLDGDRITASG